MYIVLDIFSKVKNTKPSLNEGLSAKQDLLPFLRYNQTTSTYNNPMANVKSENSSTSISVSRE